MIQIAFFYSQLFMHRHIYCLITVWHANWDKCIKMLRIYVAK